MRRGGGADGMDQRGPRVFETWSSRGLALWAETPSASQRLSDRVSLFLSLEGERFALSGAVEFRRPLSAVDCEGTIF